MFNAIKPGGWILVEELDGWSMQAADLSGPSAEIFNRTIPVIHKWIREKGIMDPYFGRRVRFLVEQLHFQKVGFDGFTPITHGGEPLAKELSLSAKTITLLPPDLFPQNEQYSSIELVQDPSFYFVGNTLFGAWGRKPP
jgi:hypothetical protein